MKNRYEGLLVLDSQGKEETIKDIIERLEKDFAKEGADVEQVQKMEKRDFTYSAGALTSGYFVNFIFTPNPSCWISCARSSSSTPKCTANIIKNCVRKRLQRLPEAATFATWPI